MCTSVEWHMYFCLQAINWKLKKKREKREEPIFWWNKKKSEKKDLIFMSIRSYCINIIEWFSKTLSMHVCLAVWLCERRVSVCIYESAWMRKRNDINGRNNLLWGITFIMMRSEISAYFMCRITLNKQEK